MLSPQNTFFQIASLRSRLLNLHKVNCMMEYHRGERLRFGRVHVERLFIRKMRSIDRAKNDQVLIPADNGHNCYEGR